MKEHLRINIYNKDILYLIQKYSLNDRKIYSVQSKSSSTGLWPVLKFWLYCEFQYKWIYFNILSSGHRTIWHYTIDRMSLDLQLFGSEGSLHDSVHRVSGKQKNVPVLTTCQHINYQKLGKSAHETLKLKMLWQVYGNAPWCIMLYLRA